jgi:gamma-glutamyl-gamma-aminobutyrate hydrolase PuuD
MKMLEAENAIPMMLPLTANEKELDYFLEICGGFLLTGGHDVSPSVYHEKKKSWCGSCCELRDEMEQIGVNSYHHQAIRELAPDFQAMAFSEDGLIESIYMPSNKFIVGVQWHPEFSYTVDENSRKIVNAFVSSVGKMTWWWWTRCWATTVVFTRVSPRRW